MKTTETYVFPLTPELDENTPGLGGKARNILKLAKIPGVLIPRSTVITAGAFLRFARENITPEELRTLMESFLEEERFPLLARLGHAPFPRRLEREILSAVPENDLVIVRSSGTYEDSSSTSLAGHYESLITRTRREDLLFTIKTCWLVGLRVFFDHITDRAEGKSIGEITDEALESVALVIQEVIDAEKSGIYFSQSPIHPGCALAVANWGTCHSCVDGSMASDFYVIRDNTLESRVNRYKFEMTVFHRGAESLLPGETITTPLGETPVHFPYGEFLYTAKVPSPRDTWCVLWGDDLSILLETVDRVKKEVGYEIDTEWSFAGDKLYMLQVRPITTEPPEHMTLDEDCRYVVASRGIATGPVKIVLCPEDLYKVDEGDIIAVLATDPDYMPILYRCSGIVSQEGSPLSHTAIVARELKIPCILGVPNATRGAFIEGEIITVDAEHGRILRPQSAEESEEIEEPVSPEESEQSQSPEKDTGIIYDITHLGFPMDSPTPKAAISAILHGFMINTQWSDPRIRDLKRYLDSLKRRYHLPHLEIHWDINDPHREFAERDPLLAEIRESWERGEL